MYIETRRAIDSYVDPEDDSLEVHQRMWIATERALTEPDSRYVARRTVQGGEGALLVSSGYVAFKRAT